MNLLLSTDNWEQSCDDFCTKWADLFLTPNDIASFKHMIGFHAQYKRGREGLPILFHLMLDKR